MNKFFLVCLACVFSFSAGAQTQADAPTVEPTMPFGKIDKVDLEATSCDFEPDANAEVLFDKGKVSFTAAYRIMFERHIRIKIFNDKGKNEGNIRIVYFGGGNAEDINDIQAETINMNSGKIEFTKVEKANIYRKPIDKIRTALTFSFPNVQPGSVIEFKYTQMNNSVADFPDWYFQNRIPTRYSEISASYAPGLSYNTLVQVQHPYMVSTGETKAIAYLPSLTDEPNMTSIKDNADRILFQLSGIRTQEVSLHLSDTWKKLGLELDEYDHFGGQFSKGLKDESLIINKAKSIVDLNDKIIYIFNEVKNNMKWNGINAGYTSDGTSDAWNKKTGNSTEINLILYHLLQKAGVKAYPMLVSTRDNGKVNRSFPNSAQFNKTVAFILSGTEYYVLDATNKYNTYNEIPYELLNGMGFYFNREEDKFELLYLKSSAPVKQMVTINAEIKPEGKMAGTVHINSFSYNRTNAIKQYQTDGEKKYIDFLIDGDNNLKISSLKLENMEIDTLPLLQNIAFNQDLSGSDGTYIYFNSNLFTGLHVNPFLNEGRHTNIDFGYNNKYVIKGIYKIPAGYKVDAMPQSVSITTGDGGIAFKRITAEEDGVISLRYAIDFTKTIYFKQDYPDLHAFYKQMYELLNEQIVLKKI